jgi:MFS family permease
MPGWAANGMNDGRGWLRSAALAMAVDTVGVLPVFLTGALAVQLREDIGLEVAGLGLVYTSYFVAAALLSAPLGRWSERTGPELALRLGTATYAVAFVGIAALVTSPPILAGFVLLAGIGTSMTRTASSLLVARNVPEGRQGSAFALKHCSIPVGTLLAGIAVPTIALTIGWRWAYVAAAVLTAGVFLVLPHGGVERASRPHGRKADLSMSVLLIFAVSFALGAAAASSLGAYTVSTAVSAGMQEGLAGVLVAMGSIVGILARLSLGRWSDRRPGSQLDLVYWLLTIGGFGFAMLAYADEALLWLAVPLAFATGWAWFGSYNFAMIRLNPVAPGTAVGVTQTGAFIGAIVGPAGLGFLADHSSFTTAWLAAAAASFSAAAMIFAIRRFVLREPSVRRMRVVGDPVEG